MRHLSIYCAARSYPAVKVRTSGFIKSAIMAIDNPHDCSECLLRIVLVPPTNRLTFSPSSISRPMADTDPLFHRVVTKRMTFARSFRGDDLSALLVPHNDPCFVKFSNLSENRVNSVFRKNKIHNTANLIDVELKQREKRIFLSNWRFSSSLSARSICQN